MVQPGIILVPLFLLFAFNFEIECKSHVAEICGRGQGDKRPDSPKQKKKERLAEENDDDPLEKKFFYQGDMRITPKQKEKFEERKKQKKNKKGQKRDVSSFDTDKWPEPEKGQKIRYKFDSSLDEEGRTQIAAAIRDFEMYTCLRFENTSAEKPADEDYFINFKKDNGCWSYIGRLSKDVKEYYDIQQDISIGEGCAYKGTVIHEMLHCLGFHHEHSRLDRDQYVKVLSANISPEMISQFEISPDQKNLGVAYDYNSVMHYPLTAFSINEQQTLQPISAVEGADIGNRDGMSASDIEQVELYYGCTSAQKREHVLRNGTVSRLFTKRGKGGNDRKEKQKKRKKTDDEEGGKCQKFVIEQENKS